MTSRDVPGDARKDEAASVDGEAPVADEWLAPGADDACIIEPSELARYPEIASGAAMMRKDFRDTSQLKEVVQLLAGRGSYRRVASALDWSKKLDALEADMPAFAEPIEFVRSRCRLRGFSRSPLRIPPILLFGRPGVGKSYFASRLAKALGVPSYLHSLQTSETVSTLTGIDKHWANSEPGVLFREIVLGTVANPFLILDELDKARAPSVGGYAPARELLSLTETATSRQLRDKCADLKFDASYKTYVACANALSPIERPLLSRFRIFAVPDPDARTRVATARSVAREALAEAGLADAIEPPTGTALQQLALADTARQMRRMVEDGAVAAMEAGRSRLLAEDFLQGTGRGRTTSPLLS